MENNIRTMKLLGEDDWNRPVYKCIETGDLYKDVTLGSDNPELYSCGNDFDGEPCYPIKSGLEIIIQETTERPNREKRFNYMMLSRLRMDCDFYLGYGNRNVNRLCEGSEKAHIERMKELHNGFSDNEKPEWLTYEEILQYEKLMVNG